MWWGGRKGEAEGVKGGKWLKKRGRERRSKGGVSESVFARCHSASLRQRTRDRAFVCVNMRQCGSCREWECACMWCFVFQRCHLKNRKRWPKATFQNVGFTPAARQLYPQNRALNNRKRALHIPKTALCCLWIYTSKLPSCRDKVLAGIRQLQQIWLLHCFWGVNCTAFFLSFLGGEHPT